MEVWPTRHDFKQGFRLGNSGNQVELLVLTLDFVGQQLMNGWFPYHTWQLEFFGYPCWQVVIRDRTIRLVGDVYDQVSRMGRSGRPWSKAQIPSRIHQSNINMILYRFNMISSYSEDSLFVYIHNNSNSNSNANNSSSNSNDNRNSSSNTNSNSNSNNNHNSNSNNNSIIIAIEILIVIIIMVMLIIIVIQIVTIIIYNHIIYIYVLMIHSHILSQEFRPQDMGGGNFTPSRDPEIHVFFFFTKHHINMVHTWYPYSTILICMIM